MSTILRIELILFSILFIFFVLWTVKKEKLLIKHALIWLLFGCVMLLSSLIPKVVEVISDFFNFEKTSNMIFFLSIIILFYICFYLTINISKQADKIRLLVQEVSLLKKEKVKNKENHNE